VLYKPLIVIKLVPLVRSAIGAVFKAKRGVVAVVVGNRRNDVVITLVDLILFVQNNRAVIILHCKRAVGYVSTGVEVQFDSGLSLRESQENFSACEVESRVHDLVIAYVGHCKLPICLLVAKAIELEGACFVFLHFDDHVVQLGVWQSAPC
jgi:hypothetical protein